jgi:hypothetical protein
MRYGSSAMDADIAHSRSQFQHYGDRPLQQPTHPRIADRIAARTASS